MDDALRELAALAPIGTFLIALGAFLVGVRNRSKIEALHIDVDGRLTELLEVTRIASRAEGVIEGAQQEKDKEAR